LLVQNKPEKRAKANSAERYFARFCLLKILLLEINREMPLMNLRDTQARPQAREIENEQTNAWRHQLKSNEKIELRQANKSSQPHRTLLCQN